jgi:proton-dependent oligopeptide transporter, POT family
MSSSVGFEASVPEAARDTGGIAGHPRGLTTLFFTEMWERFSYYGMKAILILYMIHPLVGGGMQLDVAYAGLVVGTYTSSVYWTPLLGGWIADRFLGTKLAVLAGGIVIACGHFSMAVPTTATFYLGLVLISLGTGLLKPNMSAMVGQLYTSNDDRRDAGFSIFYMGINIGAMIAPFVCGYLAQREGFKQILRSIGVDPNTCWHWAFGAAGVGMVLGLIQYVFSGARLKGIGGRPKKPGAEKVDEPAEAPQRSEQRVLDYGRKGKAPGGFDVVTLVFAILGAAAGVAVGYFGGGGRVVDFLFPTVVGTALGYVLGTVRTLAGAELRRVLVIFILFLFSIVFWMSFEQAGTSLNLFADRLTDNIVFGFEFPSAWYQSVQPAFVILLAPVFAMLWVGLGSRDPSSPAKFSAGLFFAGLAFALMALASHFATRGKVSPMWLVGCYFIQTLGELCLSPVGLSTVTKLSPGRMVGLMMGVWFLSISFGDFIAGWSTRFFNENDLVKMFGAVAGITFVAAVLLFAITPLVRKMIPREITD